METTTSTETPDSPKPCCHPLRTRVWLQVVLGLCIGVLLAGLGLGAWFIVTEILLVDSEVNNLEVNNTTWSDSMDDDDGTINPGDEFGSTDMLVMPAPDGGPTEPVYVGVLSLEPYLESRGTACNQTWGSSTLISKLQFFSHLRDGVATSLPVVNLEDVPADDYWHSYKTFRMLEYVCRHHVRRYAWFVRAVDDVYIDAAKLRTFLSQHDHNKKLLFGHPTQPVDEASYQLLGGRGYCLGGPALVISQALLIDVCPHLPRCSHEFREVQSDVALARCIADYADTECADTPKNMERFYNTYERNPLSVLEALSGEPQAITLHPLKQPWMMYAHHQHRMQQRIHTARQLLTTLESEKHRLVTRLSAREHNDTILTLRPPAQREHEAIVFDGSGNMYHAQHCDPADVMSPQQRVEINEALHLANTSSRMGDLLDCSKLIGGYIKHDARTGTTINTQLLCRNMLQPDQYKITEVTMKKDFGPPIVKKDRRRDLSTDVVVMIHSNLADSRLMDLLLNLKLIASRVTYHVIVYIVLTPGLEPSLHHSHHYTNKQNDNQKTYNAADIESWYRDERNLKVHTYNFDNGTDLVAEYATILRAIAKNYSDATVLLTETDVRYDTGFFQRCRAVVRQGKQIYHPYPKQTVFTSGTSLMYGQQQQVWDVLWTGHPRPMCVHIADLKSSLRRNSRKQIKHAALKAKHMKVTSTVDVGLSITY